MKWTAILTTVFIVAAAPANAQFISLGDDGIQGSWDEVTKCAKQPIPRPPKKGEDGYNNMLSSGWQEYSAQQQSIILCRWILAARASGWRESGTTKPNLFPPVPSHASGDFKEPAK